MSKRICRNCGSIDIRTTKYSHGGKCYVCNDCYRVGLSDFFPEYTLFHRITTSPEELAPHFVFLKAVFVTNFHPDQQWISTLTEEVYPTRAEAIAATVAKLKGIYHE